jgi:metallophosphoesterase superfamily enzyme
VTPFENVPVALNNRVAPTVKLSGEAGVIATEDNVATDKMAGWLVIPDKAAVILVFPAANPVANPVEEMEAIVLSELAQVTFEVMSAVEPSKYVPVAVK